MHLAKEILWSCLAGSGQAAPATSTRAPGAQANAFGRPGLLCWSSCFGAASILLVSMALAAVLSYFMRSEILDHDATLTSQFIAGVVQAQAGQSELAAAVQAQGKFYDPLRRLPDVLLVTIVAQNGKVSWSTNPLLIGTFEPKNDRFEEAFAAHDHAPKSFSKSFLLRQSTTPGAVFLHAPQDSYVETYVPVTDAQGAVLAVAKVHKSPDQLLGNIRRGHLVVWTSVMCAAVFFILLLLSTIRRSDAALQAQHQGLPQADSLCVVGEMSAAVAHGIRNPLACIRSCAELSLEGDIDAVRKNASNIIDQVDRLGRWVRDLLEAPIPQTAGSDTIDLVLLAGETLQCFKTQLEQSRVSCAIVLPKQELQRVKGNFALASQTLAVIVSNAIEAMPGGGKLSLRFEALESSRGVRLLVEDTGPGMLPAELEQLFRPYFTTKRDGMGLGLALAKRIMERFGGDIDVHSQKGVGTRVGLMFTAG